MVWCELDLQQSQHAHVVDGILRRLQVNEGAIMTTALVLSWITTFLAVFVADVCWTYWGRRIKDGAPHVAANWAAILFLTSGYATISFVGNFWLLIPATAGAWLGTRFAIWWDERWRSWETFSEDFFGDKDLM